MLIPKFKDLKQMGDFRPISFSLYYTKIISKTMPNELKPFLSSIILVNRNAFIPKRLIIDNALVGFEIFHAMKRKGKGEDGTVALKLDMRKTYDRV